MLGEICAISLDDDVIFSLEGFIPIREDDVYGGYRASLIANFESLKTPLKVDITTGDCITPKAALYRFPSIFDNKTYQIQAYNLETILAEKVETIIRRGVLNTRLRDFYDVYILIKKYQGKVDKVTFKEALENTSSSRISGEALKNKSMILAEIRSNDVMLQRWKRYCKEYSFANGILFDEVIEVIEQITN